MTIELPIACSLEDQEMQGRVAAWESLLTNALIDREATDRGVQLVLQPSTGVRGKLDELIALESKCCAWMSFDVSENTALMVEITADNDLGRRAVQDLFLTDVSSVGG